MTTPVSECEFNGVSVGLGAMLACAGCPGCYMTTCVFVCLEVATSHVFKCCYTASLHIMSVCFKC